MIDKLSRELMAVRVSAELHSGQVVNLGIGLPTLVANYVSSDRNIILHSENGLLGYGQDASEGTGDIDLINARGQVSTFFPGGSILSHNDALSMARSGHLDVSVLAALQVSERGDLANWFVPEKGIGSPGAALDMAAGAKRLIVMTEHTSGDVSKIMSRCTYPLTVESKVDVIITDVAVMEVSSEGLILKEYAPGWSVEAIRSITDASLIVSTKLKQMEFNLPEGRNHIVDKVYPNVSDVVSDVFDGAVVLMDGFGGLGGMPHYLMLALRDHGARNLTVVGNTAGIARVSTFGAPPSPNLQAIDHSIFVETGQISKVIASFPVSPSPSRPSAFEQAYKRGEVEMELVPQGTLAERLRSGGCGVAAFYTPTGVGTVVARGKEIRKFGDREFLLERAIRGDFAFIRAHKADKMGNLVYRGTSRNFNAVMAKASDVTIAEVDEIVDSGDLDPEIVVTPGVYVDRIVQRPQDFSAFQPISED